VIRSRPSTTRCLRNWLSPGRTEPKRSSAANAPLEETSIEGVLTTISFHQLLLEDEGFVANEHTTTYVENDLLSE